jgi:hypothetical protein
LKTFFGNNTSPIKIFIGIIPFHVALSRFNGFAPAGIGYFNLQSDHFQASSKIFFLMHS